MCSSPVQLVIIDEADVENQQGQLYDGRQMPRQVTIKAAAAQLTGLPLDRAKDSLDRIESAVTDAAGRKVDLLVLPECAYPAYWLESVAAYRGADRLSSAEFVAHLSDLAQRHGVTRRGGDVDMGDRASGVVFLHCSFFRRLRIGH